MGFTGTPLVVGEEATRREFGDYVSIYNFRDAITDGATVPLYYENRIPELQLVNEAADTVLYGVASAGARCPPCGQWPSPSRGV
jgi:type I restriction enzyme R subunit